MASRVIENALQSLRAEYEATPDLRLTSRQAAEILNVDWNTSVAVLQALELIDRASDLPAGDGKDQEVQGMGHPVRLPGIGCN